MATQKKNSGTKGQSNLDFSNRFRNTVGSSSNVANDKKRDDENIPWSLLITVMAVLLCFFIVMPIIGFMLYDLHYATQAAVYEAKKMRQLRKEILEERLYGR
jgi:ABC-type Fe3+ transport system permease subunit